MNLLPLLFTALFAFLF